MNKRTAVVTGAAGTIGAGAVGQLLKQGRRVVMVDKEAQRLEQVTEDFRSQGEVLAVACDLASADAPAAVIEAIARQGWDPAAILVNNAAISIKHDGHPHNVVDISLDEWDIMFRINVTAPMLLSKAMLPAMVERRWGRIVNISSRAGRYSPNQAGPSYSTTKAAILGLTRSIANDFSRHGVTCNSIAPGFVASIMSEQIAPSIRNSVIERTPVGRGATATEVGSAIAYLTSEDAGFVSGTCLDVNGGHTMS